MEERLDTQLKKVRKHLLDGKSITPIEALNMFGAFRLGAIIFVLRKEYEMNIVTEMIYNGRKRYAKYYIN